MLPGNHLRLQDRYESSIDCFIYPPGKIVNKSISQNVKLSINKLYCEMARGVLSAVSQIYWDESERRLSQMCGGGK